MGLPKGKTNNPAGRPAGSKNKVTGRLREAITAFLEEEFGQMVAAFGELQGRDRIKAFTELLQYALPKLQSVSSSIDFEGLTDSELDEIIHKLSKPHAQQNSIPETENRFSKEP